jgi:hypothetical protein
MGIGGLDKEINYLINRPIRMRLHRRLKLLAAMPSV